MHGVKPQRVSSAQRSLRLLGHQCDLLYVLHFQMPGRMLHEVAAALASSGTGYVAQAAISSGAFGYVVLGSNPAGEQVAIKCVRVR